jgi:predicted permease
MAVWTVGVVLIAGASWREGWRRVLNPPAISIVLAVALNFLGAGKILPAWTFSALGVLGACAVPLGLVVIGGTLFDFLHAPRELLDGRVLTTSVLLRLGLLPLLFLAAVRWIPFPHELKQVMVIQAAMPAGISPLVIARHFGGQPLTAAQVILGTTAVGLLVIPLWIRVGILWAGLGG